MLSIHSCPLGKVGGENTGGMSVYIREVACQLGKLGHPVASTVSLPITVACTTVIWIAVTYLTAPTPRATLLKFYRLVRPAGPGWAEVRAEAGATGPTDRLSLALLGWTLGCLFVYSALFGTGSFLYGRTPQAVVFTLLFGASAWGLTKLLPMVWGSREEHS